MLLRLPRALAAAVLLFALLFAQQAVSQLPVPPLKTRVADNAQLLSPQQAAALEQKLKAFEARKGSQLAVLTLPTTRPETIEQYSIRVAEAWKLGRKNVDDGVLLLVAVDDRQVRIEVGRGLEGVLPDAVARRIIDEHVIPRFKARDMAGGIDVAVDRMIKVIDGEPLPAPDKWRAPVGRNFTERLDDYMGWGMFLVVFLGGLLRWLFGAFLAALIVGAVGGLIAAWLGAGLAISIFITIVAFVLTLFGISAAGSGGGGGSSGGGWSGGGGTFGGGGASGRW